MYLIYKPEGEDEQRWWFDPRKMKAREAEAIEKRTGWDWQEVGDHLMKGSSLARRALLWTYLRREHHVLRFEDVDFAMDEVDLEFSKEELQRIRDKAAEADSTPETAQAIDFLDAQIAEAPEGPGKAPASNGG